MLGRTTQKEKGQQRVRLCEALGREGARCAGGSERRLMSWRAESVGRVVSSGQTMSGYVMCLRRTGKQLEMLSGKMTGSVLYFITITWALQYRESEKRWSAYRVAA